MASIGVKITPEKTLEARKSCFVQRKCGKKHVLFQKLHDFYLNKKNNLQRPYSKAKR